MSNLEDCSVFVAVEGLHGCGTTEFAAHFARAFGRIMWERPWWGIMPALRHAMERHCEGSPLAWMLFQALTTVTLADPIKGDQEAGHAVVLDRYWLSLAVYHRALGSPCTLEEIAAQLPRPHITFYLHAPLAVRRARIEREADGDRELARWTLEPTRAAMMEAHYRLLWNHRLAGDVVVPLDATEEPGLLAERAIQRVAARLPPRRR